jgi:hypothetical protein
MNNATRIGLGAGIVGGLAIAALVSEGTGALSDNVNAARETSGTFSCPDDDASPCTVEVFRVRPLKAAAVAEAAADGLEVSIRAKAMRGTVTRADLRQFLANKVTQTP